MRATFHYVSYVVGTFLVFPLQVLHIIPVTPKEEKKFERTDKQPSEQLQIRQTVQGKKYTEKGVKRNRSWAQKDVRTKFRLLKMLKKRK